MKVVLQDGIKDCGICSLLSVIRFYGGDVSKEYLRELTNTTKSGVSAYNILKAAEELGFLGYGVKGSLEDIKAENIPCIAHLIINKSYQHFVVIYNINFNRKKVLIMDPAKGKRILSFSEFRLLSSNNYIYLRPNKKIPIFCYKKVILEEIKKFIFKRKGMVFLIIVLSSLYFLLNILTAFHFKFLLEFVINYSMNVNVLFISYYLLVIYISKEIICFVRNLLLLKWISMLDYTLTLNTYKKIILLPYFYYKNRTTGEVISRVKDLSIVKSFLSKLICSITTDLFTVIIFIIFMFNISFRLTCYVLIIISFLFLYNFIINKYKKKVISKYHKNEDMTNSYLIESLTSVDAIKGLHVEEKFIEKFKKRYSHFLESFYKMSFLFEVTSFFKNNVNNILLVIIYGVGVFLVVSLKLDVAELFIYQGLLNYLLNAFNNLVELQADFSSFRVSLRRIHDMFSIKQEQFGGGHYYKLYSLEGDILYKNLTYSYNNSKIFDNLNLTIKSKEKILITGSSGIGKSTLVKILMRYINVSFGEVKVNGIDINHYHLDVLRERVTYVTGNEFLFSGTIYKNIAMDRSVTLDEVKDICKLVLANEFIESDYLGYQRIVEEDGFNFSGGERQRIILARTLLKNSDIYIFDEALSQIDIEREKKILKNIFGYLKNKTVIVISHHFDNQELFDRMIRLKDGKVIEEEKV